MDKAILDGQFARLPNGTRLHYASCGERGKPLILFIHGFPEFWYEWEAQLPEFGRDRYAVAPDLRGFNLSDMPDEVDAYKPKLIVEDLRLFVEHLGYRSCIVVAHDWGGAIAWNLAIGLPQLVEKLVIINSPHPWTFARDLANDAQQQAASQYMNWLRAEGSEKALAKNDFALLEAMLNGKGTLPTPWFTPEVRAKYHACWARGLHGGVNFYRASPLYPPTNGDPGAARLQLDPASFTTRVPTLVIWGERDIALRPSLLDGLDKLVGQLRVERIPEGTHWVVHEQPQRINALIRSFVD